MRRLPHSAAFPFVPALAVLFALGSTGFAQGPLGGPTEPARFIDFERFRALTPAERLRTVEGLPGAKAAFQAAARGELTATIIERGSLDAATVADLTCTVKARGKDSPTAVIKWVVEDGTVVKKGDRLVELDDSGLRDDLAAAKVRAEAAAAAVTAAGDEVRRAKRAGEIAVR